MRVLRSISVEDIIRRGSIKETDVERLSSAMADDPRISQEEAEQVIALNAACPVQSPAWSNLFTSLITDHLVNQAAPEGYVTAEQALWLTRQISSCRRIERTTEIDLLVSILTSARWVPQSLIGFALSQVRDAVVSGRGPLRPGEAFERGAISPREIELVRLILCAFGGEGRVAITRPEAEILLDINDEIVVNRAPGAWTDLFVKAMASVVLGAYGYAVPTRAVALKAGPAGGPPAEATAAALRPHVEAAMADVRETYGEPSSEERSLARLERQRIEIVTNEPVVAADERWVAVRLIEASFPSPAEEALIAYCRDEGLIGGKAAAWARGGRAA